MQKRIQKRKNTLLLFSKIPEVGKVKTRLSVLKDGIFQPDATCNLYHRMLFDVAEICCYALNQLEEESNSFNNISENTYEDSYEFAISTTPASNVQAMAELFYGEGTAVNEQGYAVNAQGEEILCANNNNPWQHDIVFTYDEGANFDIHYNGAFEKAWERDADCIVSFGADMPALTVDDIQGAFRELHAMYELPQGGVILSPDQEMGVSIVGWCKHTPFNHTGVYYCQTGLTVLPAYIQKAREANLPVRYIPAVPDVDTLGDLRHNATLVEALCYASKFSGHPAPRRTQEWLQHYHWDQVRVMPNNLLDPREEIDK